MTEKTNILALIQSELRCPKGQTNSFGKYKYRSCEDILEAVKPVLFKHDASITLSDSLEVVNVTESAVIVQEKNGGKEKETTNLHSSGRVYIKATAILAVGGERLATKYALAREPFIKKGMDPGQVTGAASSYARKYALCGLLGIDDTKDADTNEQRKESQAKAYKDKFGQGPFYYNVEKADDLAKVEGYLEDMGAGQVVEGFPLWRSESSCPKVHTKKFLLTAKEAKDCEEHFTARLLGGRNDE